MVFFEPLFFWKPPPPSSDFESEKEDKITKKKEEEEEKKRSQIFGVAQKFEKSQKKLEEKLSLLIRLPNKYFEMRTRTTTESRHI